MSRNSSDNKAVAFFKAAWEYVKYARVELLVLVGVIALDLITKAIVDANMYLGESIQLIPNLLYFRYVRNTKAAFGSAFGLEKVLGDDAIRVIFLIITVLAVGVFAYLLYRCRKRHILMRVSIALIIGGAIGNFVDRLVYAYVRDFIAIVFLGCDLPLLGTDFPVFNVADMGLTIGVILFLIYFIAIYKEPKEKKPTETVTEVDSVEEENTTEDGTEEESATVAAETQEIAVPQEKQETDGNNATAQEIRETVLQETPKDGEKDE